MKKKLIFSVLVLHICAVLGYSICNDCMEYTKCKAAFEHVTLKRDRETMQLFSKAYCGMGNENGEMIHKVCCSFFPSLHMMPSLDSRSGISKDHLLPETCGSILGNRIFGGKYAKLYEFPWMALISYNTMNGPQFECSGTIINSKYILTAAHCVVGKNILGVRMGELDYSSDEDCDYEPGSPICEKHYQDMAVEKAIPHSEFIRMPPRNDIALLKMEGEIDLSYTNVEPICLPITSELQNRVLDHKTGTVAGWGVTDTQRESTKLMKVDFPVKSNSECKMYFGNMLNQYPKAQWNETMKTMKNQFCAGESGKDSCKGDSGGPFMIKDIYKDVSRYVQYGVVSHGPPRCGSDTPGFYTDVRKYINWILDNITD
ncbi:serine protease easter-like [Pieris brassicae]|uniref:serine protease easter-like n=1 Tax=Pieris brassicae TaxID=7116 RepID=UPI001E66015F|nr:serine protease easter-like [Pieris brassicae]